MAGRVEAIDTTGGRVRGVHVTGPGGGRTHRRRTARSSPPGPFSTGPAACSASRCPIFCELHAKIAWNDALRAMPRDAPLTIWTDPMTIPWSPEERAELAASPGA